MQYFTNKKQSVKLIIFILFIWLAAVTLSAEIRAMWVTAWELTTPAKIDSVVTFARVHGIKQIMIHCRYRGDALYYPNRIFDLYPNPEPVSYILGEEHFDPLAYMLNAVWGHEIEVHAWVTVFVVTPRVMDRVSADHIYFEKPYWITSDFRGKIMATDSYEGAYLDPGIPDVHDYLMNVFRDLVVNYPVDGIHLDYIRYPDSQFGHSPGALANYKRESSDGETNFHDWRSEQVTRFVRRLYAEMKYINSDLIVSAAVFSNLDRAKERYSQDWIRWLDQGYLDYAYMMAYSVDDDVIREELKRVLSHKDKIVVGLRAWSEENRPYHPDFLVSKIGIARKKGFAGIALFSYNGLLTNTNRNFIKALKTKTDSSISRNNNIIFGYTFNSDKEPIVGAEVYLNGVTRITYTDINGFFIFMNLPNDSFQIEAVHSGKRELAELVDFSRSHKTYSVKREFIFP